MGLWLWLSSLLPVCAAALGRGQAGAPAAPRFDLIILLSAPAEVLVGRLVSRTGNSFGKSPNELERVLDDLRAVEPLLRHAADHEIRTVKPLSHVVTEVLRLASAPGQAAGTVTLW